MRRVSGVIILLGPNGFDGEKGWVIETALIDLSEGGFEFGPRAKFEGYAIPGAPSSGLGPGAVAHAPGECDGGVGFE